jgi:hypothetical protein
LRGRLGRAEELADNLQQELSIQQATISDQEAVVDDIRNENDELRMQIVRLETALEEK